MSDTDAAGPPPMRAKPLDPRLLTYASASRWFFLAIGAVTALQTIATVAFAWLLTRAVIGAIDGMPWPGLSETLRYLAVVVVVRAALIWTREVVASRAAARVQSQLRNAVVAAIDDLGPEWLANENSAAFATTAGRGLDALEAYFGRYLPQLVQTVVATPLLIVVMWWTDWISGLTVLLTLPLIPIFMVLIGYATRATQERQWRTLRQLAMRFADTVQGMSTLKIYGRQHRAAASIERVTADYRRETMRVLRVSFLSGFALEFLASISVAIIAVSIGFRLIDGSLALAVGLFVLLLAPEAYLPLRQVGVQFHAAAEGVAATDDVFDVLEAARARTQRSFAPDADPPTTDGQPGTLTVTELSVHRGSRRLAPVSFTATPGSITLIEGPSGAGKSSLLAALRGAASFEGGASYGRANVRDVAPSNWLAWAGQQPGLISGTVLDNVAIGDDAPDEAAAVYALSLACADGVPLHLELGVQGAGISGGQAQRVAVARAVYRHLRGRAGVVALDEPSSALDAATEARLWQSLRSIAEHGATVLLVSHRTSARSIADQVIRLAAIEVPA